MAIHFGEHLMIDGYSGDFDKLWDKDRVFRSVDELPEKEGMRKLVDTVIITVPPNDQKDPGGLSAYTMIAESHISIHTFPARGFVSIDFYTCRNGLRVEEITAYFKEIFDLKDIETNFIKRGTRFPKENIYDPKTGEPVKKSEIIP